MMQKRQIRRGYVQDIEIDKTVNYSGLIGVPSEAAKELKAQNEALRSRIEALERA